MREKTALLLLSISIILSSLNAQIVQSERFEFEISDFDEFFNVISAEDDGVFLIRPNRKKKVPRNRIWDLHYLDTSLVQQKIFEIPAGFDFELRGYDYYKEALFLLYENTDSRKYMIYAINPVTEASKKFEFQLAFPIILNKFDIISNSAILGGSVTNRASVIQYDFNSGGVKVLAGFYDNNSELLDLKVDEEEKKFYTLNTFQGRRKRQNIKLKIFDYNGELLSDEPIRVSEEYNLLDASVIKLEGNESIITGTYTNKRSKFSRGMFFTKVYDDQTQLTNFYNFADLPNFFNFLKVGREIRVRKKIAKRKLQGKELKFDYRMLVTELIENNGEFIMLGEAYFPTFSSSQTNFVRNSFFNPGFNTFGNRRNFRQVNTFSGYKYTHAVVISFDENGELIWDNSFEINDIVSFTLDQSVEPLVREDGIILFYNFENVIRTKIIEDDDVVEGKTYEEVELLNENDQVKNNEYDYGGIKKWYGDYLYAFGIQRIKNLKDPNIKLNRKVFFLNKITYGDGLAETTE